ncbi:MAG: hypothetical protein JWM68_1276 [Verrucomicrobiales bacterium]|nr:hypothetical protein [Verrucomicrobiales bacterium]
MFAANNMISRTNWILLSSLLGGLIAGQAALADDSKPELLQAKGVENFYRLTQQFYSGSTPEGEAAFAELKKRGIRTIISVDGAKPDVATAKKFGLTYVHLPFGYDGIPSNQAMKLVKAGKELPKPIYVHCHHGLHRGPAGAAVICEGVEQWTPAQAHAWLKQAGTSTNYLGLYKSVETFRKPSDEELKKVPANFAESTETSPLVDAMVAIDEKFDNLKLIKKAGYQTPASHPDLVPAHEALLLEELFKELLRSPASVGHGPDFQKQLATAGTAANDLHVALAGQPIAVEKADACLQNMSNSCTACHKTHRNGK